MIIVGEGCFGTMLNSRTFRRFVSLIALTVMSIGSVAAQQRDGTSNEPIRTPQRLFELPDIVFEIPKRLELTRTDRGRLLTRVSNSQIDWPAAFAQLGRDLQNMRANANAPMTTTVPNATTGRPVDERGFRQFVVNVRDASRTLRTVDRPKLPILLPPDPEMLDIYKGVVPTAQDARAIAGKIALFQGLDDHYAATFDLDGAALLINGSRLSFRNAAKATRDRARRLSDGTQLNPIERDDVGVSISFNRFGAAYTVEVVCDDPRRDTRCNQNGFINDIYRKLLLFGGKPRE